MSARRIVVFGATGAQGGTVLRALTQAPYSSQFTVVGVSRNPDSDKAKAIASELSGAANFKGFVAGDLDKVDSLREAVRGAWGVFGMTNWWEIFDTEREIQQGKNIVDACREENVQFVIYSGLPCAKDFDPSSDLYVDHLDGKATVEKYLLQDEKNKSIPFRTAARIGCYYQNWLSFFVGQSYDGGKTYAMTLPMEDKNVPLADVDAYGPFVAAILTKPEEFNGKTPGCVTDPIPMAKIAAIVSKATGASVFYNDMPFEQFRKLPFPHADELARMFLFFTKFWQTQPIEEHKLTKTLVPNARSFEQWAEENKDALRKVMGLSQ